MNAVLENMTNSSSGLLRYPSDELMMSVDTDIASLLAMSGLIAVVDEQHRIVVRQFLRSRHHKLGRSIRSGHEVVRLPRAVERGEADGLLVEMIFEQAVMAARPQLAELD